MCMQFIYSMSARQIRLIAHRNALRTSHTTLTRSWLPEHVYPPPRPPHQRLNIGYVSSDFKCEISGISLNIPSSLTCSTSVIIRRPISFNHCSACTIGLDLQSSVTPPLHQTGLLTAEKSKTKVRLSGMSRPGRHSASWNKSFRTKSIYVRHILYARPKSEAVAVVNLNGYTKDARSDIFAARPCPVQVSLLGYAGTLCAGKCAAVTSLSLTHLSPGWCDYLVCDEVVCPPHTHGCETCTRRRQASHSQGFTADDDVDLKFGPDPESTADAWV